MSSTCAMIIPMRRPENWVRAMARKAPSLAITNTSRIPNRLSDPRLYLTGAGTWALSLCPEGMTTLMPQAMTLAIRLPSVDATLCSLKENGRLLETSLVEPTSGNKRSSIGSSDLKATTLRIAGLTKATPPVGLMVTAPVPDNQPTLRPREQWWRDTIHLGDDWTNHFLSHAKQLEELACEGATPVSPVGNIKSNLEICPPLAPVSIRRYSRWFGCNSGSNATPKVPHDPHGALWEVTG